MDKADQPMEMPYERLNEITDGFSADRILGHGTFGVVYKGVDKDGHEIAVKVLNSMQTVETDFNRELNNLTRLKHQNIVKIVGFCKEGQEIPMVHEGKHIVALKMHRALCIEYMKNGSLQNHLYDEHQGFGWQERYKIIKGICEGLNYLHKGLEGPVYHLDLKPDNILLDNDMVPKISDFGLSRILGEEYTKQTISPLGTCGYWPPEFVNYQIISTKFDIFSLGVIIVKIICGTAGYFLYDDKRPGKFIRRVHKRWRERLRAIEGYSSLEKDCQQVKKCVEIALKCIDKEKQKRPDIEYIIEELNKTEKDKGDTTPRMEEVGSTELSSPDMTTDASRGNGQDTKLWWTLPKELPANFLRSITDDFSEKRILSESVFGTVYKGTLAYGDEIAVKKLAENSPLSQGRIFKNEVSNLMAVQHENILKLIGYCYETQKEVVEHNGRYVIVDVVESFLCYECLPKRTLDKYIYANTSTIDWDTRFKITKGICKGLHFLHNGLDVPLLHMYLLANSIWLDDNWEPKITNFGLSRVFGQEQTRINTMNVVGLNGYMAPEYLHRGEISTQSDIYSLGMLILEITTGEKNYSTAEDRTASKFIDKVRQNWKTSDQIVAMYASLDTIGIEQVKACIEIALQCIEADRKKRPSIKEIVEEISKFDRSNRRSMAETVSMAKRRNKISPISTELLDIYPMQLRFPFMPNTLISSSLQLANTTDDCVGIRLRTKNRKMYKRMPLCCVVPPKSTYNLIVTTGEQKRQPQDNVDDTLTLESSIVREGDLNLKSGNLAIEYDLFFEKTKEGDAKKVHELTSKVVSDPLEGTTSIPIEVKSDRKFSQVLSVDVHPVEPWILTSHHAGDIIIWDYQAQEIESCFGPTQKPVYSAKFVEREEWIVAGDGDGTIHVYSYDTDDEFRSIEAHEGDITSLAVHSTASFVLSSSDDHLIKLWDWKKGWGCTRTFQGHKNTVTQVNFNPLDSSTFVSVSLDQTIKIWNISSSECKMTLSDHPDHLLCVYNYTSGIQPYLIIGSLDGTAQVWDVENERCVQTLKGHTNCISSVYHHPELPVLLTGSYDGTVRLWNSTSYRLENIIGFNLGAVHAIEYIKGLRRIVACCHEGIAIMGIDFP